MPRSRFIPRLAAVAIAALALACDGRNPVQPDASALTAGDNIAADLGAADLDAAALSELPEFDPADFVVGVDNPLFPLPLGRRTVYRGTDEGDPLTIVTDVTRQHKTILGVRVVVVLDRAFVDGELRELTYDWYAQDKRGNVWYLGEDTKEFEDGKVVSTAGSFEAGKNGARAGIIMPAHPKVGVVTQQESAPGVAEDRSRVVAKNVTVTVPYGTFRHCIKTADFTPLEPDLLENKWYCPGIGITRDRDVRGGDAQSRLVRIVQR